MVFIIMCAATVAVTTLLAMEQGTKEIKQVTTKQARRIKVKKCKITKDKVICQRRK